MWVGVGVIGSLPFLQLLLFTITPLLGLFFLVLWIMGLIAAINGQHKPLPLVGEYFQKWFANIF
jgi:uncharacterized membrane protein